MGTEITLGICGLTLDWSKNSRGNDHGMLFQARDRKRIRSDQTDYDYYTEIGEDPAPMEAGFCRPLRDVLPRLELLGYTLGRVEREYSHRIEIWREEQQSMLDDPAEPIPNAMSFLEFCTFATTHPLRSLDDNFISSVGREGGRADSR